MNRDALDLELAAISNSLLPEQLKAPVFNDALPPELSSRIRDLLTPIAFLTDYFKAEGVELTQADYNELSDQAYGRLVSGLCHNACLWASAQLKKHLPEKEHDKFVWITGCYKIQFDQFMTPLGMDHSWIVYKPSTGSPLMIDLTLSQFGVAGPRLFIGEMTSRLTVYAEIPLTASNKELGEFALAL